MHTETGGRHGHTRRSDTRLALIIVCMGGLVGCATTSQSEAPPATAQTEPEANPVLEKDQQMVFSRESPAPTPEQTATTPQGAATSPTPGALPTLEPKKTKASAGAAEPSPGAPPACVDC